MFAVPFLALLSPSSAIVHAQGPQLLWTQQLTPPVTGFAVTVDGVRTDYGASPFAEDGTCSCSIPLPFSSGHHTVSVIAYNTAGETASEPLVVGPTADPGGPYSSQAGTLLNVSAAQSTDATGTIQSYQWDWGDGTAPTTSSSPAASHRYAAAGTFTVTLTVTHDFPWSHTVTTTATVTAPPLTPPGTPASPNPTDGQLDVAATMTLTWSATDAASFNVRFGTSTPPLIVSSGQTNASYGVQAGSIAGGGQCSGSFTRATFLQLRCGVRHRPK